MDILQIIEQKKAKISQESVAKDQIWSSVLTKIDAKEKSEQISIFRGMSLVKIFLPGLLSLVFVCLGGGILWVYNSGEQISKENTCETCNITELQTVEDKTQTGQTTEAFTDSNITNTTAEDTGDTFERQEEETTDILKSSSNDDWQIYLAGFSIVMSVGLFIIFVIKLIHEKLL